MKARRILKAFRLLGIDRESDARELADALWLAAHLPSPRLEARKPKPTGGATTESDDTASEKAEPLVDTKPGPKPAPEPPAPTPVFPPLPAPAPDPDVRSTFVRVPAGQPLPQRLEIDRALKPFLRRYPSRRFQVLDEEATAEWSAEEKRIEPRFRPGPERWFDVAIIAEESNPMQVWSDTLHELASLMERHGAFRQVRSLKYRVADGRVQLSTRNGQPVSPNVLSDPENRRLCLIATTGVAREWREAPLVDFVRNLGRQNVVAILQMLPRHLWSHTELGDALEWVYSDELGAPNRKLILRDSLGGPDVRVSDAHWMPISTLEPSLLRNWARFVQSPRRMMNRAVRLAVRPVPAESPLGAEAAARPEELVREFQGLASEPALRLLRLLAAAPLTLPVMRLMQKSMAGEEQQVHLAEVMLSGLIERVTLEEPPRPADEVYFEFLPGVREYLLDMLSSEEERRADNVLKPARDRILQYVYDQTGRSYRDFRALLEDNEGLERLDKAARSFLEVNKRIYERREGVEPVLPAPAPPVPAPAAVCIMQFSFDGRWLLAGRTDGTLELWDVKKQAIDRTFFGHEHRVTALAFNRNGSRAASGSAVGAVRMWDLAKGNKLARPSAHNSEVTALAFAVDEPATLVSGSADGMIRIGDVVFSLPDTELVLALHLAGARLHVASEVRIRSRNIGDGHWEMGPSFTSTIRAYFTAEGLPVTFGRDGSLRAWSAEGPRSWVFACITASPEGDHVLALGDQGLAVYRIAGGSLSVQSTAPLPNDLAVLALGPQGRELAALGEDGSIRFIRLPKIVPTVSKARVPRSIVQVIGGDAELAAAVFNAVTQAGHHFVSDWESADYLIAQQPPPGDANIAAWLATEREILRAASTEDIPRILEALAKVPESPLVGFDPPVLNSTSRPALEEQMIRLLTDANVHRVPVKATQSSGFGTLLTEVARQPEVRRLFPGGIYWAADSVLKRPGRRLFLLPHPGVPSGAGDMEVVYAKGAIKPILTVGALTDEETASHFIRIAGPVLTADRLALLKRFHENIPRLVGLTAGIEKRLHGDWSPPSIKGIAPKFAAGVDIILKSLSPEARHSLLCHAVLHPDPPIRLCEAMGNSAELGQIAADCRWLYAWPPFPAVPLTPQPRQIIVKLSGPRAAEAHEAVVRYYQLLLKTESFAGDDYWPRYLINHAAIAGGGARVEELLRIETVLDRFLTLDRKSFREQIRGMIRNRFLANLRAHLTQSIRLKQPIQTAREVLAGVEARIISELAKPLWPRASGIYTARARGFTGKGIRMMVFSTGCDVSHPELAGATIAGATPDVQGHGTAVCSIIAGRNLGIAPAVDLISVTALDDSGAGKQETLEQLLRDLIHATPLPHIVCMPLGFPLPPSEVERWSATLVELANAGVLVIAAAGNEQHKVQWPAAAPSVLAVGACDFRGHLAAFSARGSVEIRGVHRRTPEVYGYGVKVPVAKTRQHTFESPAGARAKELYGLQSGTSFSAAYTAGIAALMAEWSGLRGERLRRLIQEHASSTKNPIVKFVIKSRSRLFPGPGYE